MIINVTIIINLVSNFKNIIIKIKEKSDLKKLGEFLLLKTFGEELIIFRAKVKFKIID